MSPVAHTRLRCRAAVALLAACALLPSTGPAFAQTPTTAAAPTGTEAEVQGALANLRRVGGIIQNFPLAPRYYDVEPCYPLAPRERVVLDRWNADFQAASTSFQAAHDAYATAWRNRTGAAGRASLTGARAPGTYQAQAQQLRNSVSRAYAEKADAIAKRTKVCPVQGAIGSGPNAWTTGRGPSPQPPGPGPGPGPGPQPPQPPGDIGLTPPVYSEVPIPGPPPKFCTELDRQRYLDSLRHEVEEANNNTTKAEEFRDAVRQRISGYPQGSAPPQLEQLKQRAEAEARERQRIFDAVHNAYEQAKTKPLDPCDENNEVGVLPGGGAGAGALAAQAVRVVQAALAARAAEAARAARAAEPVRLAPPAPRRAADCRSRPPRRKAN